MKILLNAVNYNTDQETISLLESIEKAYSKKIDLTVMIVCNGTEKSLEYSDYSFNLIISRTENLGYLNSIHKGIENNKIDIWDYDYVIISNVDLELSNNFFNQLSKVEVGNDVGWIAPSIISQQEKLDRNPKILERTSKLKMRFLILLFSSSILYSIYLKFFYRSNRKRKISKRKDLIYAGHGSFMIFSKFFIRRIMNLSYPSFLFGEEIYFAELCRKNNLKVLYKKNLIIHDLDHASTALIPNREKLKMNKNSLKIIFKNFYSNE